MREIAVTRKVNVAFILCRLPENVTAWHKFDNLLDIKVLSPGNFPLIFPAVLLTHESSESCLRSQIETKN